MMMNERKPVPMDRFHELLASLAVVEEQVKKSPRLAKTVSTAIYWLRNYVEPWCCPGCNLQLKVPEADEKQRKCPRCAGDRMLPYSYLEVERMNLQIKILLDGLSYYAKRGNGHVAQRVLNEIADVRLKGTWTPDQKPLDLPAMAGNPGRFGRFWKWTGLGR